MNSNRASSDLRDAQAGLSVGHHPTGIPAYLARREPTPVEGAARSSEIAMYQRMLSEAIAHLGDQLQTMPSLLEPVMAPSAGQNSTEGTGTHPPSTSMATYLMQQLVAVNRLTSIVVDMRNRIDL